MMPNSNKTTIVGLTGSIGSGKSTVSNYLQKVGYRVLDADKIAKEVSRNEKIIRQIVDLFGKEVLAKDGQLDRKAVAAIIFSDVEARKQLEKITHPVVINQIKKDISVAKLRGEKIIFVDAPLLFEAGLDKLCDLVWVVSIEEEIQFERIKQRGGIVEAEIKKRIASQMPQKEKLEKADSIIENNGSLTELEEQIEFFLKELA